MAAQYYKDMRAAQVPPVRDTFLALLNAFAGARCVMRGCMLRAHALFA